MMNQTNEIVRVLGGRRSGSGWMARCPAHDDNDPSLSIREVDGKVLLHCHAGCSQRDVIDALRDRGLWPNDPRQANSGWRDVATYRYVDEGGTLLYEIIRRERGYGADRKKKMSARRPDGNGGWIWSIQGVRRVLYRLPELLEAPIAFVVEGEKDVETLRDWGFVATTNPFGAESWDDSFNPYFAGREVIIIPDNDQPGWARARRIARGVLPYAASVRVVELDGAKDISGWFEHGHSEVELITVLEERHAGS